MAIEYILGCRDTDCNIYKTRITLRVKDKDFADEFAAYLIALGFINKIKESKTLSGLYRVDLSDVKFVNYIKTYSPFDLSKQEKAIYMRACFDGDGSVTRYKRKGQKGYRNSINFSSSNLMKIEMWKDFLNELEIKTTNIWSYEKVNGKGLQYRLPVSSRKENVEKFNKVIGTSLMRKQTILDKITKGD